MTPRFHFAHSLAFDPERTGGDLFATVPASPGVFALYGAREADQPYLSRAADLRRRIARLLAPPDPAASAAASPSRRLNLRSKVARLAYTATGSEFESSLLLYHAAAAHLGLAEARRRLKLSIPFCLRFTAENAFPRLYTTNRLGRRGLGHTYGPFPSRTAAERYGDAVLDLFKLRRCDEDLAPHLAHPGCAYGEMKRCLAPCNLTCAPDTYAAEAAAVAAFLDTRGDSLLSDIALARDQASAGMDFEGAATHHARFERARAAASLAAELVRPLPRLRAVIVQPAETNQEADRRQAAVFLLEAGRLTGPEPLSTLGVRAVKEQTSVGSSLFAQPLMLQAVPLAAEGIPAATLADSPEDRAAGVVATLEARATQPLDPATLGDHLALLRRWYYRPEKQRTGEIFFPHPDGTWPIRRILRGAARMALGEPAAMADTRRDRAAAAAVEVGTRLLHPGRPGVERVVPLIPTHPSLPGSDPPPPVFRSRRARRAAAPLPGPAPAVEDQATHGPAPLGGAAVVHPIQSPEAPQP